MVRVYEDKVVCFNKATLRSLITTPCSLCKHYSYFLDFLCISSLFLSNMGIHINILTSRFNFVKMK